MPNMVKLTFDMGNESIRFLHPDMVRVSVRASLIFHHWGHAFAVHPPYRWTADGNLYADLSSWRVTELSTGQAIHVIERPKYDHYRVQKRQTARDIRLATIFYLEGKGPEKTAESIAKGLEELKTAKMRKRLFLTLKAYNKATGKNVQVVR